MTATGSDPRTLLRRDVAAMEEYTPIQPYEVLSRRLGLPASQIIKLDANENPYGPAPGIAEALAEYPYYHIYPDPQQSELRAALSDYAGVPAANILPSHGADEMLDYLCRLFLEPGDAVINCPPTFGMYSFDAGLSGGRVVDVRRRHDYSVDVDAIEAYFAWADQGGVGVGKPPDRTIKLLFLTSPNNPSGTWLNDEDLARLLALPVLVVLDEAYVEFAERPSRAPLVLAYDNLVTLRTFSKAAGMAGLRLGYGICPLWLMEQLWKFKQPYNVSVAASVAGLAALRQQEHMWKTVARLKQDRVRLFEGLQQIAFLEPLPSQANFVLCRVVDRDAAKLKFVLEQQGILVRYYDKPGLANCIRISVGRTEQIDRLLQVLSRVRYKS